VVATVATTVTVATPVSAELGQISATDVNGGAGDRPGRLNHLPAERVVAGGCAGRDLEPHGVNGVRLVQDKLLVQVRAVGAVQEELALGARGCELLSVDRAGVVREYPAMVIRIGN